MKTGKKEFLYRIWYLNHKGEGIMERHLSFIEEELGLGVSSGHIERYNALSLAMQNTNPGDKEVIRVITSELRRLETLPPKITLVGGTG